MKNRLVKGILFLLLISNSYYCFAQFAILNDTTEGQIFSKREAYLRKNSIDTISNQLFVWCFEIEQDKYPISYENLSTDYISKNGIKFLSDYDSIRIHKSKTDEIVFKSHTFQIIINDEPAKNNWGEIVLDTLRNKLISNTNQNEVWGTQGDKPSRQLKSLEIIYRNKKVVIPKSAVENLFAPNLIYTTVNYDDKKDILYIQMLNGDGAAAYAVLWVIVKGKYIKRIVINPF